MKKGWLAVCLFCLVLPLMAQTNKKIQELQTRRGSLQKEIAASEKMLLSTRKDVRSQLNDLNVLTGQIEQRKKLIATIERDVKTLDGELSTLRVRLADLRKQLADRKDKYAASLRYSYRNRSVQDKLMFIFSADDLAQTYRRLRYVREYGDLQRRQAEDIVRRQKDIEAKQSELREVRIEQSGLLDLQTAEFSKLKAQEKSQQSLVADLQRKQKTLQSELTKKRREADRLNAQIDRLIEEEIAAAKKKRASKAVAAKGKASSSSKVAPVEAYKVDAGDRKLSAVFERNKGILPVPITGPYLIVEHYGRRNVPGLRHVALDNKGIDIKGQSGAQARAIFDGEVSAVFQYNGMTNVLVRHGSYISVYCNLSSTHVKRGQKVKTRDPLGTVADDGSGNIILHFQLRKETVKLNPEAWIKG